MTFSQYRLKFEVCNIFQSPSGKCSMLEITTCRLGLIPLKLVAFVDIYTNAAELIVGQNQKEENIMVSGFLADMRCSWNQISID